MSTTRLQIIFENSSLIVRCFIRFLFNGKANKKIDSPKSVLIIQRGKLGDSIVTTAMFRAVKRAYPECRVTVVGNVINEKVLEGNPDIDKYVVWTDNISNMVRTLKEGKYDFGCVTSPSFTSVSAMYLAGIKCISAPYITNGWSPYETKPYKIIRNFVVKVEHKMKHYVPRQYLRLLEPIGIFTEDTKKYIYWSKEAEEKINKFISNIKKEHSILVGIMPGAGNKIKQWPTERFAEIADYLIENHNAYILVIGSTNQEEIKDMISSVKNREFVEDCSWTNIDELKALMSKLYMTVSVDTGPIFIAEANGIPTIDIAGSIHPGEMAPNDGKLHLVVTSEGEPQIWTMNARIFNYSEARRQIESISTELVIIKIEELISRLRT